MRYVSSTAALVLALNGFAQTPKMDSLRKAITTGTDHELVTDAYMNLATEFKQSDMDSALYYGELGLEYTRDQGNQKGEAYLLSNVGTFYAIMGDMEKAGEYFLQSLRVNESLQDSVGISKACFNLATLYQVQENWEKAGEYFWRSMRMETALGDTAEMAKTWVGIGYTYHFTGNLDSALVCYQKAKKLAEVANHLSIKLSALGAIGGIHGTRGEYEEAIPYFQNVLDIRMEHGDLQGSATALTNLAECYSLTKQFDKAIDHYGQAIEIARKIGSVTEAVDNYEGLAETYADMGDFENAFYTHVRFVEVRDTLLNERNQQKITEMEAVYDSDRKDLEIQALEGKQAAAVAEQKRQNVIIGSVSGGLGLVLLFSIFLFNRFRVIRRQKGVIEEQKDEVDRAYDTLEEKNHEIMDSIHYARRIQSAILPPAALVKEYLAESFILYKPKDIVAGDFYWLEHAEGNILYAAADCTGHGVPGAMVSVMCSNALTKAVKELGIVQPAAILDRAVEILEERFEKSEEEVKDGMDLALCSLDTKTNKLEYAGANNPLWIIPKDAKEIEDIQEVKADKQPVGKYEHRHPFTNHEVQLNAGDCIYIFSDGFPDQFGGPKGKKLKYKPFKQMLLDNKDKPMREQSAILDTAFEKWRGELEQVDDVCVIGVRT